MWKKSGRSREGVVLTSDKTGQGEGGLRIWVFGVFPGQMAPKELADDLKTIL